MQLTDWYTGSQDNPCLQRNLHLLCECDEAPLPCRAGCGCSSSVGASLPRGGGQRERQRNGLVCECDEAPLPCRAGCGSTTPDGASLPRGGGQRERQRNGLDRMRD